MTLRAKMQYNINVMCLAFLVIFICNVSCHTMSDAKKLLQDKLMNYDKTFRPIVNQSLPVILHVGLEIVSIQEFDEVQEKLTITAFVTLSWLDEYMKWNTTEYGGLEQLVIESDKVWTPNLVLTNNVDKLEKIGDAWQIIRFIPDGISFYYPGDVFSASCRVDVTYYPWDRHKCGFSFAVWAQDATEIVFQPLNEKVQTTYFSENGAWEFYNSSVEGYIDKSYIEFFIYLERKPRFVLVNVIAPIVFMAFLNTMIFAIPVESGERISYSITVLLAIAVFLTLVGDNLPKTSSPMSFFSYYLLVVLIISICITLATIFNVRLYYTDDEDPVSDWVANLVRCLKCKCGNQQKRKYPRIDIANKSGRTHEESGSYKSSGSANSLCIRNHGVITDRYDVPVLSRKNIYRPMSNELLPPTLIYPNNYRTDSEGHSLQSRQEACPVDTKVTWKDVSVAIDKIFFVLSFLIITISTSVFFLYVYFDARR